MKNEKYVLWVSFFILIIGIILFVVVDTPVKTNSSNASTTDQILVNSSNTASSSSTLPNNASSTAQVPDARFNTSLWSATYRNDTYGFTLVFPDSWSSYRAKEVENGVQFGVEDQDNVFTIVADTNATWEEKVSESKKSGGKALPGILKKNDQYVFSIERADEFSQKVIALINVYPSILTTFTLIKK